MDKKRVPVELLLLIKKYKLDIDKINYRSIMNKIALVSAFDIAFIAVFVMKFIENVYLSIIIGGVYVSMNNLGSSLASVLKFKSSKET